MKTLKKVLAMTLAFATAMTMFISASAFTDDADVRQDEAVGALSSLGIIKGNTDGSFAPKKTVTRGEMAKMIYVLRTGKDDGAVTYSSLSTKFTDIGNTWAAPYIKYCASLGIINGRSATKFDPDATVTGLEAGKMLLVCMGYNAEKAGLTGATWGLNTAALGDENKLFQDVYQDLSVALNRENAAQEIYNALDAKTVRFDGDDQSYTNKNQLGQDMDTVGKKFLDLHTVTGMLDVSGNIGLAESGDDDYLSITTVPGLKDTRDLDFTDVTTDHTDLLGQTVKVMYKTTTSTTGKKTTTVYGVYSSDENQEIITCKASDLDTTSDADKFKIDGKKYTIDKGLTVYVEDATAASDDAKLAAKYTVGTFDGRDEDNDNDPITIQGNKTLKEAIEAIKDSDFEVTAISNNDNSKIDTIIVRQKQFGKITTKNNTKVAYQAYTKDDEGNLVKGVIKSLDLESDTPEIYDGYAKDDYIFAGVNLFTGNTTITKADKISGKVTASKSDEAEISGTWYDITNTGKAKDGKGLPVNKNTDLYVYGTYAYYTEGSAVSDLDTVLIETVSNAEGGAATTSSYDTMENGVKVKALFDDGTEKTTYITHVNGVKLKGMEADDLGTALKKITADTLYTYESDGSNLKLFTKDKMFDTDSDLDIKTGFEEYSKYYNSDKGTIAGEDIDDDAVIYIKSVNKSGTEKYKVVSGKDMSSYDNLDVTTDAKGTTNSIAIYDADGVQYAFICTGDSLSGEDTLYGVVTNAYIKPASDNTGDDVVYMDVLTADGEKTGIETEETSLNINGNFLNKGDIVEFDGDYTKTTEVTILSANTNVQKDKQTYAAIKSYNKTSGLLTFYKPSEYTTKHKGMVDFDSAKIVNDTNVIYIDQSESTYTSESGEPMEAQQYSAEDKDGYYANAFVVISSDPNELDLVVIEVNNEIKDEDKNPVAMFNTTKAAQN